MLTKIYLIPVLVLAATGLILMLGCSSRHPARLGQHPESMTAKITCVEEIQYLVYLPEGYEQSRERWPMIFFLHGMGEWGNDLEKVKVHGPPKLVEGRPDFPFIVVSPQCSEGVWWRSESLVALLDKVVKQYRIDKDRIYLTGLSMGGYGTWALAVHAPERFAAIAPICGGGNPKDAPKLKSLPVWVFHGAKDRTVPIKKSQEMVDALKACGGNVRFTIYPDANHDSWTETYNNPELYDWFLMHHR